MGGGRTRRRRTGSSKSEGKFIKKIKRLGKKSRRVGRVVDKEEQVTVSCFFRLSDRLMLP